MSELFRPRVLSSSKIRSLDEQGELVQRVARVMPSAGLQSIDSTIELHTTPQLESLTKRVENHINQVLNDRDATAIMSVGSGIDDCRTALRALISTVDEQGSQAYTPNDKAGIARRSFGIVRSFALHRSLNPEMLQLIEEPVTRVTTIADSLEAGPIDMPCPAFRGRPTDVPRMPAQLWPKVIDIFQACGEFELSNSIE